MKAIRLIAGIFKLAGRLSLRYPRLIISRRRGIKAFKGQLRQMGIDNIAVKELSASYKEYGKISTWIHRTDKGEKAGQY